MGSRDRKDHEIKGSWIRDRKITSSRDQRIKKFMGTRGLKFACSFTTLAGSHELGFSKGNYALKKPSH